MRRRSVWSAPGTAGRAAVLVWVEGEDWESVVLGTSEPFWMMIGERRKQRSVPLSEVRKDLGEDS